MLLAAQRPVETSSDSLGLVVVVLLILAFMAILWTAWITLKGEPEKRVVFDCSQFNHAPRYVPPEPSAPVKGCGAALFDAQRNLVLNLNIGDHVWALTANGPQQLEVLGVTATALTRQAMLQNNSFSAIAKWDENYLSDTLAFSMKRVSGAWRLVKLDSDGEPVADVDAEATNRLWLEEANIGLSVDEWCLHMFEGFSDIEVEIEQAPIALEEEVTNE